MSNEDDDPAFEIYIGPERPDTHMILLRGLEKCLRCKKKDPVVLLVVPQGHQTICVDCLDADERKSYHFLVERVAEWEHEQSKQAQEEGGEK